MSVAWPYKEIPATGTTFPIPDETTLISHGTIVAGDLLEPDWSTGTPGLGFTTTKALATAKTGLYGVVMVALHAAAAAGQVRVAFRSPSVLVKFTGNLTRGAMLSNEGANARLKAVAATEKVVGVLLRTQNGGVAEVFFNGVEGFGQEA